MRFGAYFIYGTRKNTWRIPAELFHSAAGRTCPRYTENRKRGWGSIAACEPFGFSFRAARAFVNNVYLYWPRNRRGRYEIRASLLNPSGSAKPIINDRLSLRWRTSRGGGANKERKPSKRDLSEFGTSSSSVVNARGRIRRNERFFFFFNEISTIPRGTGVDDAHRAPSRPRQTV